MKERSFYLKNLIEKVKDKTGEDLSWKGFERMAFVLTEDTKEKFDAGYLKYTLYEGKSKSKPRESKLDVIAAYLGYKNFRSFCESADAESDPILQSMVGNYYCYIRMNHEEANLLRSPVKIFWSDGRISYHQKGGRLTFNGRLQKHEGCLFVLMESIEGKSFYHVYRIGKRPSPDVLQGVFSGVSTDFKPIGGRALLLRSKRPFETLRTGILDIKKMMKSRREEDLALAKYFEHREENNISVKPSATFNLRDLRDR